ncbi:7405_t:CDS:2, partial [Rhizophagus irregularis]
MSECSPISRTDIKDVNIADWSVSGQLKIPSPYSQREYPNCPKNSFDYLRSPKSDGIYTEPPTDPKSSFDDLRSPKSDDIKPRR